MTSMSKGVVSLAAIALVVTAGLGSYLGYSRATAAPGGDSQTAGNATVALSAKTASPIPDAAAAAPDEAFIRKIAEEEIQSALHPKKAVVVNKDDSGDDDSDDHGPAAPPTVAAVTPTPAPANPAAPPAPPPPPPTGLY
jgi:hypothetical protein